MWIGDGIKIHKRLKRRDQMTKFNTLFHVVSRCFTLFHQKKMSHNEKSQMACHHQLSFRPTTWGQIRSRPRVWWLDVRSPSIAMYRDCSKFHHVGASHWLQNRIWDPDRPQHMLLPNAPRLNMAQHSHQSGLGKRSKWASPCTTPRRHQNQAWSHHRWILSYFIMTSYDVMLPRNDLWNGFSCPAQKSLSVRICRYIIHTLTLQWPWISGVFQTKLHVFSKVPFLKSSTVFCMLVMFTHRGTAETVEIK
jgi:hypothetical protein